MLFTKPLVHTTCNLGSHIEWTYEYSTARTVNFHDVLHTDNFMTWRFKSSVALPEVVGLREYLLSEYADEYAPDQFEFLARGGFASFFRENQVSIPTCFRKSHSLRWSRNESGFHKLANYLMRRGQVVKAHKLIRNRLDNQLSLITNFPNEPYKTNFNWKLYFFALSNASLSQKGVYPLGDIIEFKSSFEYVTRRHRRDLKPSTTWDRHAVLFESMKEVAPIFAFYVYKVDKSIYKSTRGRSGKHTFIWKYVPPYKRLNLVMSWFVKELQMQAGRTLGDRLEATLRAMFSTPTQTWAFRVRKFSHNYVYYNARNTLAETYRTTTR